MHRAERLADVVDRRHAHELDVGVDEQPAHHLRAAVAAAADDCCLESLCHRGPEVCHASRRWDNTTRRSTPRSPRVRARGARDARAHAQLGRDQQLHRERRRREPRSARCCARRSRCRRSTLHGRSRAAPATAITWSGARRRRRRARAILLVGHHDTVFPPGHFEGWREDGDRAIGPGALDMKGGLAVIRTALAALDDVGALAQLPIVVVSVADEEVGSPSSRAAPARARDRAPRARWCSSPAARNDMIITRRKGVGAMTVIAHGKAAHAGNNHKDGANAIWALAKFVDAAQQLTDYARGVTVNVGQFTGGTSKNTVPERAECKLDLALRDRRRRRRAGRRAARRRRGRAPRSPASRSRSHGGVQPPAARAHRRIGRAARRVRRVRARRRARRRRGAAARRRLRREHGRAARRARDRRPRPARRRLPHARPSTSSSPRSCRRPRRCCASCGAGRARPEALPPIAGRVSKLD